MINKSKSITKITFIVLLSALFFGIAFNVLGGYSKKSLGKTGAYLTSFGGITGIIQLGGEQLKVTQDGEEASKIYFNVDYFVTDKNYDYNIALKNTEETGGADSKYLRWKWTAVIDGVEENINEYVNITDNSETTNKQAYLVNNWYYLVDNDYIATKLSPQESIAILERLKFKGEFNQETKEYGSVLDKYCSGSNIQIYLTVQGSTDDTEEDGIDDDKWEITTPQAIIYDHEGNELLRTENFGEYTIPEDIAISKSITEDIKTLYFKGFQITNEETGNEGGSIFYPGDTIVLDKFDRLIPVYSEDEDYNGILVFTMDDSTGTYMVRGINGGSSDSLGNTTLTEITIPTLKAGDTVATIQDYGFYKYTKLETVTLGQKITTIGNHAFNGCTSLTEITIPETVTSIGNSAFRGCTSLTEITIPETVTSIVNYAFAECTNLKEISMPKNLTYLGTSVFLNCSLNIIFPDDCKLEYIPGYMFTQTYNTKTVGGSINIPANVKRIVSGAFADYGGVVTLSPNSKLEEIGAEAFHEKYSSISAILKDFYFPSTVTTIGEYAFYDTNITDIIIPASTASIGEYAFSESSITRLDFEEGSKLTVIPQYMCYDCTSLKSITIPENVVNVGYMAFNGVYEVEEIKLLAKNLDSVYFTTDDVQGDRPAINGAGGWNDGVKVFIGNQVTKVPDNFMRGENNIIGLEFEENSVCETIGEYSLQNSNITTLTLPASVKTIEDSAFYRCKATTLNLNNGLESIGYNAFAYSSFESVIIPSTTSKIGAMAFTECVELKTISLSGENSILGMSAFSWCINVESIYYNIKNAIIQNDSHYPFRMVGTGTSCALTIGKDVESIPDNCFTGAQIESTMQFESAQFTSIVFEEGSKLKTIGQASFCGAVASSTHAVDLVLPEGLETIGYMAFYACSLGEIYIPTTVTEIGRYAFG